MSADTASALYSDPRPRPVLPLPKRRLRDRLSPEVAESIQYPPAPKAIFPIFPPCTPRSEEHDSNSSSAPNGGPDMNSPPVWRNGFTAPEDRNLIASRSGQGPDTLLSAQLGHPRTNSRTHRNGGIHVPMPSAPSGDGHDTLENTNNNKKRKIPSAGLSNGSATSENNGSGGSLSTAEDSFEGNSEASVQSAAAYGTGSFGANGQNFAGPGRGRYGRSRGARSPLRPLPDSTNNRNSKVRPAPWTLGPSENTGIISDAIAKAAKLPLPRGQENTSLLQQQLSKKRGPTSAEFTFTCSSQVPGSLAFSDPHTKMARPPRQMSSPRQAPQPGQAPMLPADAESMPKEAPSQAPAPSPAAARRARRAARRELARECLEAARERREQTRANNKEHPPKPEEVWICHFCEYESIFGEPPYALIRQYEIKDRKQRQLEQQRKAQWERLKKGKNKSKKSSKLPPPPAKPNEAVQEGAESQESADAPSAGMDSNYSQGTQSEEYYDDEDYQDDEYDPDEDIPPDDGLDTCEHRDNTRAQSGHHPTIGVGGKAGT